MTCQAVIETGRRFRETILALGGGKAPLEVCCICSQDVNLHRTLLLYIVIFPFFLLNNCSMIFKNLGMFGAGVCRISWTGTISRSTSSSQWSTATDCICMTVRLDYGLRPRLRLACNSPLMIKYRCPVMMAHGAVLHYLALHFCVVFDLLPFVSLCEFFVALGGYFWKFGQHRNSVD